MLNIPNNEKDQTKQFDNVSESDECDVPPILPHWTFMPGDGRFYIYVTKPQNTKLILQLSADGNQIDVVLSCDDVEETKEFISKSLGLKKDFLNTHIQPFSQNACITPPLVLSNNPIIHAKEETKVLISFPIVQYVDTSVLVFE